MEIEFDPAKDAANLDRHGVSLRMALLVLMDAVGDVPDQRRPYGEARRLAFAELDGAWWACAYVMRDGVVRPISVHRVRAKEVRRWLDGP